MSYKRMMEKRRAAGKSRDKSPGESACKGCVKSMTAKTCAECYRLEHAMRLQCEQHLRDTVSVVMHLANTTPTYQLADKIRQVLLPPGFRVIRAKQEGKPQ